MKALSIKHPWAQWIMEGRKIIETRTWQTAYRGLIIICSSLKLDEAAAAPDDETKSWFYGAALGTVDLIDCRPMVDDDPLLSLCAFEKGRFSWVFHPDRIARFERPVPVKGKLGLFNLELPNGLVVCV